MKVLYKYVSSMVWLTVVILQVQFMEVGTQFPGCPDGWEENDGSCYRMFDQDNTYDQAVAACQAIGSDLTSILSTTEQNLVKVMADEKEVWIGLHDKNTEDHFEWVDGSILRYTNWADDQPDNWFGEDCVHLFTNGEWNDADCNKDKRYVCKTEALLQSTVRATSVEVPTTALYKTTQGEPKTTDVLESTSGQSTEMLTTSQYSSSLEPSVSTTTSLEFTEASNLTTKFIPNSSTDSLPTSYDKTSPIPGNPDKQRDQLSTELVIGTAVGAVLLLICVIIILTFFFKKRKLKALKYPVRSNEKQHAYDGPYDLTVDGNDSVIIQRNGTIKYNKRTVEHQEAATYQNVSPSYENKTIGDDITAGNGKTRTPATGNYENTAETGDYENAIPQLDKQISVVYAKPIKVAKQHSQLSLEEESQNPNEPEYSKPGEMKHDSSGEHCPATEALVNAEEEEEEDEVWEDNALYGVSQDTKVDAGDNVEPPPSKTNFIEEEGCSSDASLYAVVDDPQYIEVIETGRKGGYSSPTSESANNNDDSEGAGWKENDLYGTSQDTIDEEGNSGGGGWMDNEIYGGSDDE